MVNTEKGGGSKSAVLTGETYNNKPMETKTMATTTTGRAVTIPVPKSKNGILGTFETTAKWSMGEGQPQGSATGTFTGPSDPVSIEKYLATLSAEDRNRFYRDWFYGADLRKKASLRPAAAEDSPWLTRDNIRINLATGERINSKTNAKLPALPLEKRIAAVNTGFADADTYGGEPKDCFVAARKLLLSEGMAVEANGGRLAVKK